MATDNKLSFTIRRPTPVSRASSSGADSDFKVPALPRHLSASANSSAPGSPLGRESPKLKSRTYAERDSSDEDEATEDELVTGFDQFGVQRLRPKEKPQGPLVIPALQNRDWRELARKRKNIYLPPSAAAATGADGSVGGLGTKDTINSGPQISGLQVKKKVRLSEGEMEVEETTSAVIVESAAEEAVQEETEDQKALRALLASAQDDSGTYDGPRVDIIPAVSEDDAYRQDVVELPDPATMEDYERIPVSQFGAALLRGMGWKEGTAASRKGKGPVEPWLPQSRPALLGIGAKEKEVLDDGTKRKGGKGRPEKRYVPVTAVKKERHRSSEEERDRDRDRDSGSGTSSRRRSPSPAGDHARDRDRHRSSDRSHSRHDSGYERAREGDRDGGKSRRRDDDRRDEYKDDRDQRYRDKDRERDRDSERRRDRSPQRDKSDRYRRERDRDRRDY